MPNKTEKRFVPNIDLLTFLDEGGKNIDDIMDTFGRHAGTRSMLFHHTVRGVVSKKLKLNYEVLKDVAEELGSHHPKYREIQKLRVLHLLKDGQWRSRAEVFEELGMPERKCETLLASMRKAGDLVKVGAEFRNPKAVANKPSARVEKLYEILESPILQQNIWPRMEDMSDWGAQTQLQVLEKQGLATSMSLIPMTKKGEKFSRPMKFWCQTPRARKLEELAVKLEADENGVFCIDRLPKRHTHPRTARFTTKAGGDDTSEPSASPSPI
jgi:hypothetical protein